MTSLILALYLFSSVLLQSYLCQQRQCPRIYQRYSQQHSYCKPMNASCPIYYSGVKPEEIKQILDVHNTYRNLVATGGERRAGGLPQAADMIQMVWDQELAAVAQRTAEQCIFDHDCHDCRRVVNFPVGQNMGYANSGNYVPDWAEIIQSFYDEVARLKKRNLKAYAPQPETVIGHFTQVVWSRTWRIGCGYVAFKREDGYGQLYVCNYGPRGNVKTTPVYQTGPTCSGCPTNSCCGKTCKGADYAGLCRMNKNDEAAVYRTAGNFLFYCDCQKTAGDCNNSVFGSNKWRLVNALGGPFGEVVLKGGETTTLKFKKLIRPKQGFCLVASYRFGPAVDGRKSSGKASIVLEKRNNGAITVNLPVPSDKNFFSLGIHLGWSYDTLVSITFSVPPGEPSQFFNIQLVTAKEGKCS